VLLDRRNLHDFCRKSRYFAANRKLHWISRLVECHSTFLGISYRLFRQGKRDYPPLAAGVFAQILSMFSSYNARPNCVCPSPPVAEA